MPKAIARVLGLTDRAIRLAPLRADAADILHPLLFIFDTAKQVGQRYFPPGYVPSLEEDAAASLDRFLRRDMLARFATREAHFALREALILALAGVAAFLFLNHENLYLTGPFTLSKAPLEAYFLVTTVMYLFLRLVVIALGMRVPRARPELVRCPECGQWIDDSTAAGREAHHRIELTPKPSPKAIVSTVALGDGDMFPSTWKRCVPSLALAFVCLGITMLQTPAAAPSPLQASLEYTIDPGAYNNSVRAAPASAMIYPRIAIDHNPASPRNGTIYVVGLQYAPNGSCGNPAVVRSIDGGRTFDAPHVAPLCLSGLSLDITADNGTLFAASWGPRL